VAYCPSLTDLNNLFAVSKNQFDKTLYQKFFQNNPFMSLFPRVMYDYNEGRIPEVVTTTSEMPVEFPIGTAMGSITLNTGTGNACLVDPTIIKNGYTSRTYQLQTKAFETPELCLTDLQFDYQAVQAVMNYQKSLEDFSTAWWRMWYEAQTIGMVDTKITTLANCQVDEATSQGYDFNIGGLTLPTAEAEWCHLTPLYDRLAQTGAGEFAVGYANGLPLYSLNVGPGYKRKLWQVDQGVRDTVNWGDAFENFTARGINMAVYGFIPNVNLWPARYDSALRWIPPFLNTDATRGRKYVPNPAYKTPALGGNASYELITVTARDIFEVRVAPGDPNAFGKARFDPQNYMGDVRWINNPDMCNNKLGNMGQYRMDIRVAPKPIYPDNGFAILTVALDVVNA
jgi:hypothetical protein